jgi:hypothetical protein
MSADDAAMKTGGTSETLKKKAMDVDTAFRLLHVV